MKKLVSILALGFLACGQSDKQEGPTSATAAVTDTVAATNMVKDTAMTEEYAIDDQYANFYVVIADTGKNYYELDKKMYQISKILKMEVDTMNRYYNKDKKEIVVKETDEDEMYRGEYFPRRFPSTHLSLEHLKIYNEETDWPTMVLVGGIYESKREADSVLNLIKPQASTAHVRLSKLYVGCMH